MNEKIVPLHQLPIGAFGKVKKLSSQGNVRRRMLDLGLITDTRVESLRKSPSGDPTAYEIRGAVIALRSEEASKILVEIVEG
ncbi:FeoA family protein [Alkaliphilus peptidifermentans]|uniref:Ferrous iron transport protein A n=1 Tax=Alkaliphilus peptidifermentans DSM 18978 TaxID=1120976 RepID=A0A1G5BLS5_9FIRM|nr:FeoA family protein [Alkaliphilus peptidifermentans]SCX91016.1 ferrous iron transport protein A [Alkaliphilus peptidifermentans DSM 18978]